MSSRLQNALDETQRAALDAGQHEAVARELAEGGTPDAAAEVLEQIWDFEGAHAHWSAAGEHVAALRCGIEARRPELVEASLDAIEADGDAEVAGAAARLLEHRGRHREAARMMAQARGEAGDPTRRAEALVRAGDRLGAARLLADSGRSQEALQVLGTLEDRPAFAQRWALAAHLCWDLGDAERTARCAQAAMRQGDDGSAMPVLLARALGALGHDLAAQIVLRDAGRDAQELSELPSVRGRFHVTSVLPASLAGTAYAGYDRVTLAEVEIHVLLSELSDGERPGPEVMAALRRFAATVEASNQIGHPAIRPVLRAEPNEGIVVMPRAEGASLRSRIRPPGMAETLARARALVAFMLEALVLAHARGVVHGSLLPSQIVTDALGRPQLGPFGAHHLAGLTATRTAGLEELLSVSAPETREGALPTEASDVFSLGRLYGSLVAGDLDYEADKLPAPVAEVVARMTAADPDNRPRSATLLRELKLPVADMSRIAGPPVTDAPGAAAARGDGDLGPSAELGIASVNVELADSWTDELLELLCSVRSPHLQPILDRTGRQLALAAWTEGCRVPDADFDWRGLGERSPLARLRALEVEGADALHRAIAVRMRASSLVRTPGGDWMLALDDLLTR